MEQQLPCHTSVWQGLLWIILRSVKAVQVQPGVNTPSHTCPVLLEAASCSRISSDCLHMVRSPNSSEGLSCAKSTVVPKLCHQASMWVPFPI